MSKVELDVNISVPWITEEGIRVDLFLGSHEPSLEETFSFEEIINEHLDMFITSGVIREGNDREQAEDAVIALERAAEYARKRFEKLTRG